MGKDSNIAWTHHTFNPWWGCEKVSEACAHCYAESWAKRTGFPNLWSGERRFFSDKHWREPLKWNAEAEKLGVRYRVFCASMADVFDNHPAVTSARMNLWELIRGTPNLDWLLLTKRIGNVERMVPGSWLLEFPRNVWLGISVIDQNEFDRDVPKLRKLNPRVRFLSVEPMLGLIEPWRVRLEGIHWVICGGESGSHARDLDANLPRKLLGHCRQAQVPFFFKQGSQANWGPAFDMMESFPADLQVREYPI